MSQLEEFTNICEGMLATDEKASANYVEHKQTMLSKELERFNNTDLNNFSNPPRIIKTILDELSGDLIIQTPEHNMTCHSRSHVSTGGGGFGKSHDKRC